MPGCCLRQAQAAFAPAAFAPAVSSLAELVEARMQRRTATRRPRRFFAGVIYDPVDAVAYRLRAPVELQFGAERELILPLPTLNDYLWVIELPHEPVDPEYVTVITEGPLTEANLWEF